MKTNTSNCIDHGTKSKRYTNGRYLGRCSKKHRIVYCKHNNLTLEDIDGLVIRHTCDNPRCINPDHLLAGTHKDNGEDVARRRRGGKLKLTVEQVLEIRSTCKPGKRGERNNPFTFNALGRKFGVDARAIGKVYQGITHKFTQHSDNQEEESSRRVSAGHP